MSLPTNFFIGRGGKSPTIADTAIQRFVIKNSTISNTGTIGDGVLTARAEGWGQNGSTYTDYIRGNHTTNNMTVNQNGSYTVSYWVYGYSDPSGYWMFFAGDNNMHMYTGGVSPRIGDSSHPVYGTSSYGSGHINLNSSVYFSSGSWDHWVWSVTVSSGYAYYNVYKNGVQGVFGDSNPYSGPTQAYHYYGARNSGQYTDVGLKNITYFDYALSSAEVQQFYSEGG